MPTDRNPHQGCRRQSQCGRRELPGDCSPVNPAFSGVLVVKALQILDFAHAGKNLEVVGTALESD